MRRWEGLVSKYLMECEARGLAETTIYHWELELNRFGGWLRSKRPRPKLEEVGHELVVGYVKSRAVGRTKATVCRILTAVRGIGDVLVAEGIWHENPARWIQGPKIPHRVPKVIRHEDMAKMAQAACDSRGEFRRYQSLAVISLAYGTGLRRGELSRLNVDDWIRDEGLVKVDGRKTRCERMLPVSEETWQIMEGYLPRRQNKLEKMGCMGEQALFVNRNGRRLNEEGVSHVIHRLAKVAGVKLATIKLFRSTCATDLLEAGASLAEVRDTLGHAVLETTMRYVQIGDPMKHEAIAKHPVNRMLKGGGGNE
jgi:site-specific recombinase XerD